MMETYKNLKKGTKIGTAFVFAVLCAVIVLLNFYNTIAEDVFDSLLIVQNCVDLALCGFVVLYAVWGYKKPHGNMLKAAFLVFCLDLIINTALKPSVNFDNKIENICALIAAAILAYIAGRLHENKENKILLIVAGALLLVNFILPLLVVWTTENTVFRIGILLNTGVPPLMLAALGFAYTARYEEHKAAGLADKQDAENCP